MSWEVSRSIRCPHLGGGFDPAFSEPVGWQQREAGRKRGSKFPSTGTPKRACRFILSSESWNPGRASKLQQQVEVDLAGDWG